MGSGSGVRFGGRVGRQAGGGAAVLAVALVTLSACTSSGSDITDSESPTVVKTSTDPMAAVRVFCADLQTESSYGAPVIGSPMTGEALALFDRMATEAPAPVKDAMQTADAAAHDQAQQSTADGMKRLGEAMQLVTTWASSPTNCPLPGK